LLVASCQEKARKWHLAAKLHFLATNNWQLATFSRPTGHREYFPGIRRVPLRHKRSGFTLIEILAVICIILVLIAMVIGAYRHISQASARRETIAELHICRGLLQEYEGHNGVAFLPTLTGAGPLGAPGGDTSNRASGSMRYTTGVVVNTKKVMAVLMQVPANRTVIEGVQNKRILEPNGAAAPSSLDSGVVLLDGWGDPIIAVPATGLLVNILDPNDSTGATKTQYVVRSSGTYVKASAPAVSAGDRPFFASAGQDGDFSVGEDNVYSFQD
jgi:prepilin-type N-terminal cleavage/methylation domain-containing protein